MEPNWAVEHLQVIRTLMERSALYRRALAPIMIFNGTIGIAATAAGIAFGIASPRPFILYWAGVAVVAIAGSFFLVRRQALKESEPFWSPPTRRVTQAFLPAFTAGAMITLVAFLREAPDVAEPRLGQATATLWLPLIWVVLYGCAIHAAGFFMPRGMKLFGWAFIVGGCALLASQLAGTLHAAGSAQAVMGFFFGGLHLAYGGYLYFSERRRNAT
jgi:hypothetical protein